LNYLIEGRNAFLLFWIYLALATVITSYSIFRVFKSRGEQVSDHFQKGYGRRIEKVNHVWLILSLLFLLIIYFMAPDSAGSATYINLRILLLFWVILILFLSSIKIPDEVGMVAAALVLFVNIFVLSSNFDDFRIRNQVAVACQSASFAIPENALVLPVNFTHDIMLGHAEDYVATDRRILLTHNSEAETRYFPVIWKNNVHPDFYIGLQSPAADSLLNKKDCKKPAFRIDFIFIVTDPTRENTSVVNEFTRKIETAYRMVFSNGYCKVFRLK
jgi:hypothetical protein